MTLSHSSAVAHVLAIHSHPRVPVEVDAVEVDGNAVRIALTLRYTRDRGRVCCGEPGCYVGFLGRHRKELPELIARELALPGPARLSLTVKLRHEPGYEYIDVATGASRGMAHDATLEYDPAHFSSAPESY